MNLLLALFLGTTAQAAELTSLRTNGGSAWTIGEKHATVALFGPARYGLTDRTELSTTGLLSLLAPRLEVKHSLVQEEHVALAVRGGLGLPLGLGLLRGTLLSSDPYQTAGVNLLMRAGVVGGVRTGMLTTSLGVEGRAAVGGSTLEAPDMGFLDPLLAPITEGPVVRPEVVVDLNPVDHGKLGSFQISGAFGVQLGSGGPDWQGRTFAQLALSRRTSLGGGWAFSYETARYGKGFFSFPMGDVRLRW